LIPLTVLGGYLGAGKTTILNAVLSAPDVPRIAVLVNDFGDVNIDAALIRNEGGPIVELANGCVCCSVQDDIGAALESLREHALEHVIIEASGVAMPARIAHYGDTWPGYRHAGTAVVVDASRFERQRRDKFVGRLVSDQLLQADLLLVTKLDLVSRERSSALLRSFAKPYLEVIDGDVPLALLLDLPAGRHADSETAEHPRFHAFNVSSEARLATEAVEALLDALPATVVRAKGWFRDPAGAWWLVQATGERRSLQRLDPPPETNDSRLLFIALSEQAALPRIAHLIRATTGADALCWS
jgi:G3E family GTPase